MDIRLTVVFGYADIAKSGLTHTFICIPQVPLFLEKILLLFLNRSIHQHYWNYLQSFAVLLFTCDSMDACCLAINALTQLVAHRF